MMKPVDTLEMLKKLVSIPSPYYQEEKIARFLEKQMESMGFAVTKQPVLRTIQEGKKTKKISHYNVLAEKGSGEKSILLYAHMDTVPPINAWSEMELDPYKPVESEGRLIGLGASDMKAGIAAIIKALEGIEPQGYKIKAAFGVDEENYSMGAHILLKSDFLDDVSGCIVPEAGTGGTPACLGKIILGRHGRCRAGVSIKGKAAHASMPEESVNPIKFAFEIIRQVESIDVGDDPDFPTGNVSTASINSQICGLSSPEECFIWFDFLYSPPQSSAGIFARLDEIIKSANKKYSLSDDEKKSLPSFRYIDPMRLFGEDAAKFERRRTPFQEPYKIDKGHPLVTAAAKASAEVTGKEAEFTYGKSNADENYFGAVIPTIVIPPVGGREHQGGEFAEIDSLDKTAEIIKKTILKYGSTLSTPTSGLTAYS